MQAAVRDADVMILLVGFPQALQNRNRVIYAGLDDLNGLKPPRQRAVALHVFPVFVKRRRADALNFTARQGGLEHAGGVERALRRARAHQRVDFVNENDHLPVRGD